MTIGEKIRKQRKAAGLTQKALGEKCSMPDSQIRQYELGKVTPRLEQLQRIADALEINLSVLTDREYIAETASHIFANVAAKMPFDMDYEILELMLKLNDSGIQKMKEQLELLTKIPEYKKENTPA